MKIFIVEDHEMIVKGLTFLLNSNGYDVDSARTIEEAKNKLTNHHYQLVLLDLSLPDGDGFQLCSFIKNEKKIPVLVLTARDNEDDIVKSFQLGADDYVVKPFRNLELLSRIHRILKDHPEIHEISNGETHILLDSHRVFVKEKEIFLTALEYRILVYLYSNMNQIITRDMLFNAIWNNEDNVVNDNTLTVYIKRIREKLGNDDIQTIKSVGYRVMKHE